MVFLTQVCEVYHGFRSSHPDMGFPAGNLLFPVSDTFLVNIFFAITIVFVDRKNPNRAVSWILVLLLLPFLGFFLYLVFGQNYRKEKLFSLKNESDQKLTDMMESQIKEIKLKEANLTGRWSGAYQRMALLLLQNNRALITTNNHITPYTDGKAKFADLIKEIGSARDHVHMQYFILKDDGLGRDIMKALTERARAGVEVRLLVDGVGSGGLPKHFYDEFTAAGGKHAVFFPSLFGYFNFRVNFRNHRKIAVIDGETAFIGGFNIGDDYLGLDKHWGYWRDAGSTDQREWCTGCPDTVLPRLEFCVKGEPGSQGALFPPEYLSRKVLRSSWFPVGQTRNGTR